MSNTTMPFTPSEIMTAGKIARFAMQFDHFDDVISPVIDQLVEAHPQGKGYDPEEAYMQYMVPAADAMFGYRTVEKLEVQPQHFHTVKAALARLLEFSFRQEVLGTSNDPDSCVLFPCDQEIRILT